MINKIASKIRAWYKDILYEAVKGSGAYNDMEETINDMYNHNKYLIQEKNIAVNRQNNSRYAICCMLLATQTVLHKNPTLIENKSFIFAYNELRKQIAGNK